jgi:hypothetical protein
MTRHEADLRSVARAPHSTIADLRFSTASFISPDPDAEKSAEPRRSWFGVSRPAISTRELLSLEAQYRKLEASMGGNRSDADMDERADLLADLERFIMRAPFRGARALAVKARVAEQYLFDQLGYEETLDTLALRSLLDGIYQLAKVAPPPRPSPQDEDEAGASADDAGDGAAEPGQVLAALGFLNAPMPPVGLGSGEAETPKAARADDVAVMRRLLADFAAKGWTVQPDDALGAFVVTDAAGEQTCRFPYATGSGRAIAELTGGPAADDASPDAELLDLGRQYAAAVADYEVIRPEARAANLAMSRAQRSAMDAVKARGESLDDNIEELTAASEAFMPIQDREDAILRRVEDLGAAIGNLTPRTFLGLRVHADVLAFTFGCVREEPLHRFSLELQAEQAERFAETCRAFFASNGDSDGGQDGDEAEPATPEGFTRVEHGGEVWFQREADEVAAVAPAPDPILAAIEAHRAAWAAYDAADLAVVTEESKAVAPPIHDPSLRREWHEENGTGDLLARLEELEAADDAATDALVATMPTTPAGAGALVGYAHAYLDGDDPSPLAEWPLAVLANAAKALVGGLTAPDGDDGPRGGLPAPASSSDPVFALIQDHEAISNEIMALRNAMDATAKADENDPALAGQSARLQDLFDAQDAAADALLASRPGTEAGVRALALYGHKGADDATASRILAVLAGLPDPDAGTWHDDDEGGDDDGGGPDGKGPDVGGRATTSASPSPDASALARGVVDVAAASGGALTPDAMCGAYVLRDAEGGEVARFPFATGVGRAIRDLLPGGDVPRRDGTGGDPQ